MNTAFHRTTSTSHSESNRAVTAQRAYYESTAADYDRLHVHADPEHDFALSVFKGYLRDNAIGSLLDVGAGTGRVSRGLAEDPSLKHLEVVGIEPVESLRILGHAAGVPNHSLVDGDATDLPYQDGSFDAVCAFAVLHHIPDPRQAINEMLRVARKAIFISDSNCYGQGSRTTTNMKWWLRNLKLWPMFQWITTGGKGFKFSEEDGVFFSYSIFDSEKQIRRACRSVHVLNTRGSGNIYRECSHGAILGLKDGIL